MYLVKSRLPSAWQFLGSPSTLKQPVVGFAVVLVAAIWIAAWLQIETERREMRKDVEANVSNLAIALEQNVARSIDDIDRLLLFLREAHERSGYGGGWPMMIRDRYTASKEALQIAVTDAKGMLIASSLEAHNGKKLDLSDRPHFKAHTDGSNDHLHISRPVLGRVSGRWSVQLTRRYYDEFGNFDGVIIVSFDPSYLSRAYGAINLGESGGLALVGNDDIVRGGTGSYGHMIGLALTEENLAGTATPPPEGGVVFGATYKGTQRIVAARPIANRPLYVLVAGRDFSEDAVGHASKNRYLLGATILTLIAFAAMLTSIRKRQRHERQISHLARHDSLTGLGNRVMFREAIDDVCSNCVTNNVALHLLDLDRFKFVNDTYGHPVGDKLLKAVSERLLANTRQSEIIARLGGDEFAILQRKITSNAEADALAERLVRVIGEPYFVDGLRIDIGVTIGIAIVPKDTAVAVDLVKAADLALYSAKMDGRNRHRFFDPGMDAAAQARRAVEEGLKIAVEKGQLEVHYQPINDITTNVVTGYEALVRWRHPERGLVPPLEFISIAEESGLIIPIGAWVLRRACEDMTHRPHHLRVAVNFSPVQFLDPNLVTTVKDALKATGLHPSRLEIEITESTLMRRDSLTIKHLTELRELGMHILMDDFGTGYSSLSYLQSYPISGIKIDRSFVNSLSETGSSAAIVRAITTLATSLGMSTIAEGVETVAQLDQLRQLGCTEAQGYYFSRPRPAAEILPESCVHAAELSDLAA